MLYRTQSILASCFILAISSLAPSGFGSVHSKFATHVVKSKAASHAKRVQGSSSRFVVEIGGVIDFGIQAFPAIQSSSAVILYKDGGTGQEYTIPGRASNEVTLQQMLVPNSIFYLWRKSVIDGRVDRRSVSVIFLSDSGEETSRMNLFNCWPKKWTTVPVGSLGRSANETLTLQFETMEYKGK